MIEIRAQGAGELAAALGVSRSAFGDEGAAIAALVDDLQSSPAFCGQSWIAWDGDQPVGHVMLSRGWIDAVRRLVECPVLSPLSVVPSAQGRGIGRALVAHAVAAAGAAGAPAVVLEGDPQYYGRLGFEPAEARGVLRPSTAIPEPAFQWVRCEAYEPWMRGRFVYPDVFWRHDAVGLRDWRREHETGVEISTVTLGARDPVRLARFYGQLLGISVATDLDPAQDWIALRETNGWSLAIQLEPEQVAPVWPARAADQHMQAHLEIRVDDLQAGMLHALACGARLAEHQPQDDVRVMLDPEGHPFCLWVED